ncbi:MAG: fibro-slime domain-containing protein [Fibrobacterota bacterium]|nr:MAG: fibro-slime domain-containing protein [Fibrobacterota bacterium]
MSSFVQMFRIRLVVWLVLGAWGASSGKTIMWLGNFFQQGAFQNGTVYAVDSMWVQRSDSAGTQGYYFGARNQQLVKSTAFVDQAIAKSPLISWWSIPTWGGNLYRNGNLRLTLSYRQAYGTAPNQNIQAARNETQEMNGRYSAMPNVIDSCLDNIPGDTAWMYFGTGQESSAQTRPVCSDHNPYLQLKGTIHLLNPWPGRMAYVRWNGIWQPLYGEPGRPGWVVARFYALASATVDQQILFASADPADGAAGVQYMDMTGIGVANNLAPWNFTALATPWERWIAPPLDGTNIPKMLAAKPALTTTLMIRLPSWNASAMRVTWKGVPGKFIAQSTSYCNWYAISFYAGLIPASIALNHPYQDTVYGSKGLEKAPADFATYANWIAMPAAPAADTLWLNTNGAGAVPDVKAKATDLGICNEKILAFKVYDYKLPGTYFPFSEKTNSDLIKGMVGATLGADGLPTYTGKSMCGNGDPRSAECTNPANGPNNWFKPNAYNTTGCLLQPLTLNRTSGQYEFASSEYFPIDDSIKNPAFNEKLPPTQTQSHDFGFCMHAKSTFEYVPGLSFSFRGDDDVWVFIDKRLALDIGGQHGPIGGDINLDKMNLLEGHAYQFDMFYCERHTPGSNIRIQTTMNLVPSYDYRFDSTALAGNGMRIDLRYIKTEIDGSKCQDQSAQTPVPGKGYFFLQYPDGHSVPIPEPPQPSGLDGVTLSADLTSIDLNLAQLKKDTDLDQRGQYKIVIRFQNDPSQANVKEIPFEITQGPVDLAGDLFDRDGDGRADSLVLRSPADSAFKSPAFKNVLAVWAKSTGARDSVVVGAGNVRVAPGDSVAVVVWSSATTPFQKRSACPTGGCVNMGMATTYPLAPDSVRNKVKVFREHIAPFADSASVSFGSGTSHDTLRVWISEGAIASPDFPTSPWAMVGNRLAQRNLPATDAINPAPIQSSGRLLVFLLAPGAGLQGGDSLRLAARTSDALGNSSGSSTVWVPIRFGLQPIRVIARDADGDGQVDDIEIRLARSAAGVPAPTGFGMIWNGAPLVAANLPRSVDLLSWRGPIGPFPLGTAKAAGDAGWLASGTDANSFRAAVEDSVAPVALSARLIYGFGPGSWDTLELTGSEPLAILPFAQAMVARTPGVSPTTISSPNALVLRGSVLRIAVPAGTVPDDAAWARLGTGVSDGATAVGLNSRWVPLVVVPSGRAALFDSDGDGRADSVHVAMRGSMTPFQLDVAWCDAAGQPSVLPWTSPGQSGSFGLHPPSGMLWFPKGATSCAQNPSITFRDPATNAVLASWPLVDSVAPIVTSAHYGFGDLADTLVVRFSEPVGAAYVTPAWVEWKGAASVPVMHDGASWISPDGLWARLVLRPGAQATEATDSVQMAVGAFAGHLVDAGGVAAGQASPFVPIDWSLPPLSLAVSDPLGQGQGTTLSAKLLREVPLSAIGSIQKLSIRWNGQAQELPFGSLAADGSGGWKGPLPWSFALGITDCGVDCQAWSVSASGDLGPAVLLDSVPPSLVAASFRYSKRDVGRDTLFLQVSEPWVNLLPTSNLFPLVTAGLRLAPLEVDSFLSWFPVGTQGFALVLDTTWEAKLHRGDSTRFSWNGGNPLAMDALGNRVGAFSRWVPIDFGMRPLELVIRQDHPILVNGFRGTTPWVEPPPGVPGLEMLVRNERGYVRVDDDLKRDPVTGIVTGGNPPLNDPERTMGVYIKLNRPLDGTLFIYDNIGTSVHQMDLSKLKELWPENGEDVQQEIKLTWNGTRKNGRFVAGGVYLMRAFVMFKDKTGRKEFHNLLWKYAWMRPNK